jgi:hypothetical protein
MRKSGEVSIIPRRKLGLGTPTGGDGAMRTSENAHSTHLGEQLAFRAPSSARIQCLETTDFQIPEISARGSRPPARPVWYGRLPPRLVAETATLLPRTSENSA